MQVTKITDGSNANVVSKRKPLTPDEFQSEIDYLRSEKITSHNAENGSDF